MNESVKVFRIFSAEARAEEGAEGEADVDDSVGFGERRFDFDEVGVDEGGGEGDLDFFVSGGVAGLGEDISGAFSDLSLDF